MTELKFEIKLAIFKPHIFFIPQMYLLIFIIIIIPKSVALNLGHSPQTPPLTSHTHTHQKTLGNIGRHFWLLKLASSGQKPGMLLSILQCTEHPHNINYMAQNANSIEVEKLCFKSSKYTSLRNNV